MARGTGHINSLNKKLSYQRDSACHLS